MRQSDLLPSDILGPAGALRQNRSEGGVGSCAAYRLPRTRSWMNAAATDDSGSAEHTRVRHAIAESPPPAVIFPLTGSDAASCFSGEPLHVEAFAIRRTFSQRAHVCRAAACAARP